MAINGAGVLAALEEIEITKGISKNTVVEALKEAMIKGYRRQLGGDDADVRVNIDLETGNIELFQVKKVVNEVEDDFLEISVEDANEEDKSKKYKDGDEFFIPASFEELKKATVISIKSILKQKFVEAEKVVLYEQFKDKMNTMITGRVEKSDERGCSVNIGKTSVSLSRKEMIGDERFNVGDQIRLYVSDVTSGSKGARINVSRANEGFLRCLFNEEIREIYDGTIEIKNIAREAGERSKVAVYTSNPEVDPAGACIGPNGTRIQKIVSQLGNGNAKEKIDIITYTDNVGLFIMDSLKPARVAGIILDNIDEKKATVIVKDDSLSLAIGKKGVNARLAVKLTGYNIDIKTETEALESGLEYLSFEDLQAEEAEERNKALQEARFAQYEQQKVAEILPGMPSGYVAPMERKYDDEAEESNDLEEALIRESEKEVIITPKEEAPVEEVKEEAAPIKEEKVEPVKEEVRKEVQVTSTLSDLEKALEDSSNRNKKVTSKKKSHNKKEEEEEEVVVKPTTDPSQYMSIYSEEELRELEDEENEEVDDYDDDIDYDEYDDYYDDENR